MLTFSTGPSHGCRKLDLFRRWSLVTLLLGCVAAAGCSGRPRASFRGSMTFKGEAIRNGLLRLVPANDTPGQGASSLVTDGKFEIGLDKGLVAGDYRVVVEAVKYSEQRQPNPEPELGGPPMVATSINLLPPEYGAQSNLTVTLDGGENVHDFALK